MGLWEDRGADEDRPGVNSRKPLVHGCKTDAVSCGQADKVGIGDLAISNDAFFGEVEVGYIVGKETMAGKRTNPPEQVLSGVYGRALCPSHVEADQRSLRNGTCREYGTGSEPRCGARMGGVIRGRQRDQDVRVEKESLRLLHPTSARLQKSHGANSGTRENQPSLRAAAWLGRLRGAPESDRSPHFPSCGSVRGRLS